MNKYNIGDTLYKITLENSNVKVRKFVVKKIEYQKDNIYYYDLDFRVREENLYDSIESAIKSLFDTIKGENENEFINVISEYCGKEIKHQQAPEKRSKNEKTYSYFLYEEDTTDIVLLIRLVNCEPRFCYFNDVAVVGGEPDNFFPEIGWGKRNKEGLKIVSIKKLKEYLEDENVFWDETEKEILENYLKEKENE